jgi:glycosyltransferase involved in cell wall biosynthesis
MNTIRANSEGAAVGYQANLESQSAMKPRYLVAEIQSDGHHARYARWVVETDAFRDADLLVAGPKSLFEHSEFAPLRGRFVPIELGAEEKNTSLVIDYSFSGLLRKHLETRRMYMDALRRAQERGPVDLIIIPYVDHSVYTWATLGTGFGNTPWVGISMLPMFHLAQIEGMVVPRKRTDWIRDKLYRRLLNDPHLRMLFTIDPELVEFATRSYTRQQRSRLTYLPDPSVQYKLLPRNASRTQLGIPEEVHLVILYGALHPRKGVEPLIRGAHAAGCPKSVHVLLAGRQDTEVREILKSQEAQELRRDGRLHVFNQYIDDELEKVILSAADFMWIGYSKFYRMSGIFVLAARHALPAIFTREGLIGHLGRKFRLGPEIDPDRVETVTAALAKLADNPHQYDRAVAAARDSFEIHSIAHFQSALGRVIRDTPKVRRA